MNPDQLIQQLKRSPQSIEFDEVMAVINDHYTYTEAGFTNGAGEDMVTNEAGTNAGSCRIFAFGRLNGLSESETLACFGRYYRDDVLAYPDSQDHGNIRAFIRHGWDGIRFDSEPLQAK